MKAKSFVDSGAYSAWAQGKTVTIEDYIAFIMENESAITVYANLDVIDDPEASWANQRIMENAGLKPIPVYHIGEPEKYLDLSMQYEYFAVGGMALKSEAARQAQFSHIWSRVCPASNNYFPTHRVHGFGLTSPAMLVRYPWYSADSTSWVMYGKYGIILLPRSVNGKFRYDIPPITITVSTKSKKIGDELHFNHLPRLQQQYIIDYCREKGFEIGKSHFERGEEIVEEVGLSNNYMLRDALNLIYFLDLESNQPQWPWPWREQSGGLF